MSGRCRRREWCRHTKCSTWCWSERSRAKRLIVIRPRMSRDQKHYLPLQALLCHRPATVTLDRHGYLYPDELAVVAGVSGRWRAIR